MRCLHFACMSCGVVTCARCMPLCIARMAHARLYPNNTTTRTQAIALMIWLPQVSENGRECFGTPVNMPPMQVPLIQGGLRRGGPSPTSWLMVQRM